jgi:hypothetical protein
VQYAHEPWQQEAAVQWAALWEFAPRSWSFEPRIAGFGLRSPAGVTVEPFPDRAAWGGGARALAAAREQVEEEQALGLWGVRPGFAAGHVDAGDLSAAGIARARQELVWEGVDGQTAAWVWQSVARQAPPAPPPAPYVPLGRTDPEDYGFRYWGTYLRGEWEPQWCLAAADDGVGVWPSCVGFSSRSRPLQETAHLYAGMVVYGDVHAELVPDALRIAYAAYERSPHTMRGTLRLGVRASHSAVRSWLAGPYPRLTLLKEYLAPEDTAEHGPKLNTFRNAAGQYVPCKKGIVSDFVVVRFGWAGEQQSAFAAPRAPLRSPVVTDEQVSDLLAEPGGSGNDLFEYHEAVPDALRDEWRRLRREALHILRDTDYGARWQEAEPELWERWERDDMPTPGDGQDWFLQDFGRLSASVLEQWRDEMPVQWQAAFEPAIVAARTGTVFATKSPTPHAFDVANRPSCRDPDKLRRIKKELDEYKREVIVERKPDGMALEEFGWGINAILIVTRVPDDGSGRMCLDPELNPWFVSPPFGMCGPRDRLAAAERHFWILRKDLRRAFYVNQLNEASRRCALFRDPFPPHDVYRFTVPAFGFVPSPRSLFISSRPCRLRFCFIVRRVAQQLPRALRELAQQLRDLARDAVQRFELQPLDFYADDWIGAAPPLALVILDFVMEFEGFAVGLPFAPKKDIYGPAVVTLGIELDCPAQRMWFPRLRAVAYLVVLGQVLAAVRKDGRIAGDVWESLVGKLQFVVQSSRFIKWALAPIAADLHKLPRQQDGKAPRWVVPSERALEFCEHFWQPALRAAPCWLLSRSRWSVLPLELAAATADGVSGSDASGRLGMGGAVGNELVQRPLTPWELRPEEHIQVLEFRGSWEVLAWRIRQDGGRTRRWIVLIDNVGAVADWNKGGRAWMAPDQNLGDWFAFVLVARAFHVDVRAVHIPGTAMMKLGHDGASREMVEHSIPLPSAQFQPGDGGQRSARQFWDALQELATPRPSPLDPFEEFCKVTPQGRNSACWVVYVQSSDSESASAGSERQRSRSDSDSEGERMPELWSSSESEDDSDSDGDEQWLREQQQRAQDQLSASRRAAIRTALAESAVTQTAATAQPQRCSARECIAESVPPVLLCASCEAMFHWQCMGFPPRDQLPVAWQCGACIAQGSRVLAEVLQLDRAAAFAASAPAVRTDATYRSAIRRFAATIMEVSAAGGLELTIEQILPPQPDVPTPEAFALAFVFAASGVLAAEAFMLNTVQSTLAGLAAWHKAKSGGRFSGPSSSWTVRRAVRALERHVTDSGGVLVARAFPAALEHMHAFWDFFWDGQGRSGQAWLRRYTRSRDFGYKLLIFLTIIRPDEGYNTTFSPRYFRAPVADLSKREYCIIRAKNHQTEERWVPLPTEGPGRISFSRWLRAHEELLTERGVEISTVTPLFGLAHDPTTPLRSSQMLLHNMRASFVAPALTRAGLQADIDKDWSGYSFRRGGINAVYRQLRADITDNETLVARLMTTGRWKSVSSLRVYLVELDRPLADWFAVRLGAKAGGGLQQRAEPGPEGIAKSASKTEGTASKRAKQAEQHSQPLARLWAASASTDAAPVAP